MLELININKNYNPGSVNELCLFKDFNLTVKDGEFVSVVGSNGSGKTSMLNIICGSIPVDQGTIEIGGVDITDPRRRYYETEGLYSSASDRQSLSGSFQGNLPQHDDPGEYVYRRE